MRRLCVCGGVTCCISRSASSTGRVREGRDTTGRRGMRGWCSRRMCDEGAWLSSAKNWAGFTAGEGRGKSTVKRSILPAVTRILKSALIGRTVRATLLPQSQELTCVSEIS